MSDVKKPKRQSVQPKSAAEAVALIYNDHGKRRRWIQSNRKGGNAKILGVIVATASFDVKIKNEYLDDVAAQTWDKPTPPAPPAPVIPTATYPKPTAYVRPSAPAPVKLTLWQRFINWWKGN